MENRIIKIKEKHIAELMQYWSPLEEMKKKSRKMISELDFLETQRRAAKALFWRRLQELYPVVEEDDKQWTIDTDKWEVIENDEVESLSPGDMLRRMFGGEHG